MIIALLHLANTMTPDFNINLTGIAALWCLSKNLQRS